MNGISGVLRCLQVRALLAANLLVCTNSYAADSTFAAVTNNLPAVFSHEPQSIYGEDATYRVYRNGKPIGQHQLSFDWNDTEQVVHVESSLAVSALGITMYRYQYTASEIWRDGKLLSVETRIKDNRKAEKVIRANEDNNRWTVKKDQSNPKTYALPDHVVNHWHPGVLQARLVYHPLHGRVYRGKPENTGVEKVELEGGVVVNAYRFQYTKGFKASVWYDEDWRWLKLAFKADDGSEIIYRCERCRPESLAVTNRN